MIVEVPIKGNRIDVCFNLGDEQKALDWGKKKVRVMDIKLSPEHKKRPHFTFKKLLISLFLLKIFYFSF